MKKKTHRRVAVKKSYKLLDGTTFMLLACVTVALILIFGMQTGTLPKLLTP